MNKKGFTLIELLATIVLLAIIVAIAIPAVNTIIGKNKVNNCNDLKDSIVRAAKLYISDNKYELEWKTCGDYKCVNVQYSDLYIQDNIEHSDQYLNGKIINPCTNEEYTTNFEIKFKNNKGNIELYTDDVLPNDFTCCN